MSRQDQGALASDVIPEASLEGNSSQILKKVIFCEIKGTLNGFSVTGPSAGTWKPLEGKSADMFGPDLSHQNEVDYTATAESLRHTTIRKATLLQSYNNFGVPLGVTVSCLPSHEVTESGERYTFTTMPNASVSTPMVLHEATDAHNEAAQWRRDYGKYTSSNLQSEGVLAVPNSDFVFVHESHPVINLLRMNAGMLGMDIDNTPKIDGQWYKLTSALMESSCDTLRNKVLGRIETKDLNAVQVQLHRIGGVPWDHISTEDSVQSFVANPAWTKGEIAEQLKLHKKSVTEKPNVFMARIMVEYEING